MGRLGGCSHLGRFMVGARFFCIHVSSFSCCGCSRFVLPISLGWNQRLLLTIADYASLIWLAYNASVTPILLSLVHDPKGNDSRTCMTCLPVTNPQYRCVDAALESPTRPSLCDCGLLEHFCLRASCSSSTAYVHGGVASSFCRVGDHISECQPYAITAVPICEGGLLAFAHPPIRCYIWSNVPQPSFTFLNTGLAGFDADSGDIGAGVFTGSAPG
ncbi:hypothetical protein VNO77_41969 [Canavalia gladiata]|uniref:Uncharacterized protein n=1 Tax=Canavalia gladiata TaxID=3824 RepID=A0AAN9K068_CANGL